MGRDYCETCEKLKEFYSLKLSQFLLAARSSPALSRNGVGGWDREVLELKEEALTALRALMRHATECYEMSRNRRAA